MSWDSTRVSGRAAEAEVRTTTQYRPGGTAIREDKRSSGQGDPCGYDHYHRHRKVHGRGGHGSGNRIHYRFHRRNRGTRGVKGTLQNPPTPKTDSGSSTETRRIAKEVGWYDIREWGGLYWEK